MPTPTDFDPPAESTFPATYDTAESIRGVVRQLSHHLQDNAAAKELERRLTGGLDTADRELTRCLTTAVNQVPVSLEGPVQIDPRLDPNSPEFSSKTWVKNMNAIYRLDPEYYRPVELGMCYKDLVATGNAADAAAQPTFTNLVPMMLAGWWRSFRRTRLPQTTILKSQDGLLKPGMLTVVLGRPGSGCSTLLKTIATNTHGFHLGDESVLSYDGLTRQQIRDHFRGEVVYNAEIEIHFPSLTVEQTLLFAAKMRTPKNRFPGILREVFAQHLCDVYMATYGLLHTRNTKVGDEYIRGVSGGERKRVLIAEASICGSPLQCWDNATRGLDSATALEFVRSLKVSTDYLNTCALVAIYQCSQDAYDLFDNVIVLYEGYQIYFGPGDKAKAYFERMGYECPARQTTADYLTSITSPAERVAKAGFEGKVPQTLEEFEAYWKASPEYAALRQEIDAQIEKDQSSPALGDLTVSHEARQLRKLPGSPYTVLFFLSVKYLTTRCFQRMWGQISITMFQVFGNIGMSLILCSIFYNLPSSTDSFFLRAAALFVALLFNALLSFLELLLLYVSRPVVEKHKEYALYHPSADALALLISELPPKVATCIGFNLVFYFMVNFNRHPGNFFFYMLMNFEATLVMSHVFRSVGAACSSLDESVPPSLLLLTAMVLYAGFALPTAEMLGWLRWINYLDPIAYTFEALMANEFLGRQFECSLWIPRGSAVYDSVPLVNRACSAVGSVVGERSVDGDRYLDLLYDYHFSHRWRNFGICLAFVIVFGILYLVMVEFNEAAKLAGERLVFPGYVLRKLRKQARDVEAGAGTGGNVQAALAKQQVQKLANGSEEQLTQDLGSKDIFHWRDVSYFVKIKSENRQILTDISGWVEPGKVTALMGASGAGKTTLLNALSNRITMGVVTGLFLVNGHERDTSFQRNTGYVQQQDLHLITTTVREALQFAALLRQPASVPREEKLAYVEEVIGLLEMEPYADAMVGVTGEGLNVEQRKRLTIGVELVAKPKLLLFLDEPTSGLDSQTAWSICQLIRKLADHGQAIMCTIHQPLAILLQEFDRLLFLQKGGQTVYFGDLGPGCQTLIDYFELYGAPKCPPAANPAEWMLEVVGAAPGSKANQDYYEVWMNSREAKAVQERLLEMERELVKIPVDADPESHKEYASDPITQFVLVTNRVTQQHWRTPRYLWAKVVLAVGQQLFNGFTFFKAHKSLRGLQSQMLSVFMFLMVLMGIIQQMLPNFVLQRDLYEVRERPSKTFSWYVFILAQVASEIPFLLLLGTVAFFCWYYPVGLYQNATETDTVNIRGFSVWLATLAFFTFIPTFGQLAMAGMEYYVNAANMVLLAFTMCLAFCGVLTTKEELPGFWIFMYRVNPMTYLVLTILLNSLANSAVVCAANELVQFVPYGGLTCAEYMGPFMKVAGGYLTDEASTTLCEYCSASNTNAFLASINAPYAHRWRDYGIFVCYSFINIFGTVALYYIFRVPHEKKAKKAERAAEQVAVAEKQGGAGAGLSLTDGDEPATKA